MSSEERVLLNVGGSKFEVLRKTFGRFPQSLLGQLSSSDVESTLVPGPNGEYFFDRYVLGILILSGIFVEA